VYAVVTGGGTSGHVLPALAIAELLVERGHPVDTLRYVGAQRGIETELVPPSGIPAVYLDVVGVQRSMRPRALLTNITVVPRIVVAVARSVRLVRRWQPAVVVNVGGYASFAASFAARLCRCPLVVVSYDRRPGLVSKMLARRASAVAAAFPNSVLPGATHTGAPVRPHLARLDRAQQRAAARERLGLPSDRFVVAVMCGSQGARAINAAVDEVVAAWSDRSDIGVYHVVGERWLSEAAPARDGSSGILYRVIGYEHDMAAVYAAADVMITRAGAGTLAELTAVGVPAIVIPWPDAAENHQLDNAAPLADAGAIIMLEQHQLSSLRLMIEGLYSDSSRLCDLAVAARLAGAHHRSSALIELIEGTATGERR
jgi:UDP-N-acetylglucosamine--N-acetylmuramyl-(pentapeptide) pyrophosphoryl-undecaprenol N-acetylglucosamine transferase